MPRKTKDGRSSPTSLLNPSVQVKRENRLDAIFPGGGEMGERIRSFDWSRTALGAIEYWPESLKTAVRICLGSRYPIVIWWGKTAFTQLYNDAYISFLGSAKHPAFLGRSGKECWSEIWPTMGPMWEKVFATGEATWAEDFLYVLNRNLPREEGYFTFSYSALRDDAGQIEGIFCNCYETTGRVIGERRLRTLRDMGRTLAQAKTAEDCCTLAAEVLAASRADIPFALIYLLDSDGQNARLIATTGIDAGSDAAPFLIELSASPNSAWPLRRVLDTCSAELVNNLLNYFPPLPGGLWPESPETGIVLPIAGSGQSRPTGFLIVGLSPRRILDADYRGFLDLVAGHIATSIANARAYEAERRRAEALAEIDRAKTTFFSNVSHELRTPLTLLLGPTESALSSPQRSLAGAELEMVHRNELRLLKLVNTLLDFSRIEGGRVQANYEPTDVASLTRDLVSEFRSAVEAAGLRLIVDCPPLSEPIYVDREMWEKIVLNLVSNSFKSTFEGEIHVAIRRAGNRADLAVRDTGTGIAKEEVPHLFERFHRIENARRRTNEGTGIGLALVAELVKLHAGSITVDTEPGRGSTFTVSIPMGTAHLPAERISSPRGISSTAVGATAFVQEALSWVRVGESSLTTGDITTLAGIGSRELIARNSDQKRTCGRVLVVDDNRDMREYAARLLSSRFEVVTAENGRAALDQVLEDAPDLVLTDIMMPEMNGFELLASLRQNAVTNTIPVIFISARAGEESKVDGLSAGADDYLVKPFTSDEMLARVQTHVQMAQRRSEQARLLNLSNDAIIVREWDGRILYWNDGAERLYGWKRQDALGKDIHKLLQTQFPEPPGRIHDELSRVGHWAGELVHRTHDGESLTVLCRKVLHRDAANKLSVLETNTDISERKQVEETLRRSEERFRTFVSATSDVIYRMNPDWSEMHYLDGKGFIENQKEPSRTWLDKYIHPDDQAELMATIQQAIRSKSIFELEHRVLRPDGSLGWVFSRAIPILNPKGEIIEWFGAAADMTERKRSEEALRDSEERLRKVEKMAAAGQLAASLAHEINNPLSSVTNVLYLLNHSDLNGNEKGLVNTAATELARVSRIVKQSLSYYRVGTIPRELDLGSIVAESLQIFDGRIQRAGIELTRKIASGNQILGFADEIRQVIDNLILNALEATPRGGRLAVSVRQVRDWRNHESGVRLTIGDSGCGISKEQLPHIFRPFFSTKKEKGTGLGLWVVSGIVAKHEARITIRTTDKPLNSGTVISIFWPSNRQAHHRQAEAEFAA